MHAYDDESDIFYDRLNVKLRETFLKFILTDFDDFKRWDVYSLINQLFAGKFGEYPYTEFYDEFVLLMRNSQIDYKIDELIHNLRTTNSLSEACEMSDIPKNKVFVWLELGKNYEEPFNILYNQYKRVSNNIIKKEIDMFLDSFDGFNDKQVCKASNISEFKLSVWLRLNNLGGIYDRLYDDYLEILSETDYSDYLDFSQNNISQNTSDMLFVLSDIGKIKYNKFYNYFNHEPNNLEIYYPESHVEHILDIIHNEKDDDYSLEFLDKEDFNVLSLKKYNCDFYRKNKIDKFLNYVSLGYDDYEASEKADIYYTMINKWLSDGIPELVNDTIFEDYDSALILNNYIDFINFKSEEFFNLLKDNKPMKTICNLLSLSFRDIEAFLNLGYYHYKPYDVFYREYIELFKQSFYEQNNIYKFLNEINIGEFKQSAAKKAKLKIKTIDEFFEKGRKGRFPYKYFLEDYENALIRNYYTESTSIKLKTFFNVISEGRSDSEAINKSKIPKEVMDYWMSLEMGDELKNKYEIAKHDSYFNDLSTEARETFLNSISNNLSVSEACKDLPVAKNTVENWLNQGELNESPYDEFFNDYMDIIASKFLKEIKKDNSKTKVFKKCKYLPKNKINEWLKLGAKGKMPFVNFYEGYVDVQRIIFYENNNLDEFFREIESGTPKNEALAKIGMSSDRFNNYLKKAKQKYKFYPAIYRDYQRSLFQFFNSEDESKRDKFLEEVKNGSTYEDALIKSNLSKSYVERCFDLKEEEKFFKKFYNSYLQSETKGYFFRIVDEKDCFIKSIAKGHTIDSACRISKLNPRKVQNWITQGQNNVEPYVEFYNSYFKSTIGYYNSQDSLDKRSNFFNSIANGENLKTACKLSELDVKLVEKWIKDGEKDISPFNTFLVDYKNAEIDYFNSEPNINKRNNFLKQIEDGQTQNDACKLSDLNPILVRSWLQRGKKDENPYNTFLENFNESLKKQFTNIEDKIEVFFNLIADGESNKGACEKLDLNYKMITKWLSEGREGHELYLEFLERYNEIKEGN